MNYEIRNRHYISATFASLFYILFAKESGLLSASMSKV